MVVEGANDSRLAIEPLGALDRTPSLVEFRTWSSLAKQDAEAPEDPVGDALEEAVASSAPRIA